MEFQAKWLTCRHKNRMYLLAQGETGYYAIEVGRNLDYATEEWLYQQGVTEELLKELLLTYQCFPRSEICGIAIGGNFAGDMISLYHQKGKRCDFILELDYDEDLLEELFMNIPRFQPPKKLSQKDDRDWREKEQDPELFEKLKFVAPACVIAAAGAACGYIMTIHWIWFTLCLICLAVQFALLIFMPAYFTIAHPKGAKKQKAWELYFSLLVIPCILVFRSRVNLLSDSDFWVTILIGIAAGLALYPFLVDLHMDKWGLLYVILFGALAGMLIIGRANQVYDFSEKESYVLEVEDLYSTSTRRSRSYYCVVTLPDGREEALAVSRNVYNQLEEGDLVEVQHGQGALGMEYANVYQLN